MTALCSLHQLYTRTRRERWTELTRLLPGSPSAQKPGGKFGAGGDLPQPKKTHQNNFSVLKLFFLIICFRCENSKTGGAYADGWDFSFYRKGDSINTFFLWRKVCIWIVLPLFYDNNCFEVKEVKIWEDSLDSISLHSPSVKIQIMGRKVSLSCEGKRLLGIVIKLWNQKVCWHHSEMFCLITSSKLTHQ